MVKKLCKREKSENKSDAIEDYLLKATYNIFLAMYKHKTCKNVSLVIPPLLFFQTVGQQKCHLIHA